MLTWDQSAGTLSCTGEIIGRGYAGAGRGKNNPSMQAAVGTGPVPRGLWTIAGLANDDHTGPFSLLLYPMKGTNTLGRAGFRIHGDSIKHPGTASHGCIILPRAVRAAIWASGERTLEVIE